MEEYAELGSPKAGSLAASGGVENVLNDIGKGYASYPGHARQNCPGFVEGLSGRGQVKGHKGIVGLLVAETPISPRVASASGS